MLSQLAVFNSGFSHIVCKCRSLTVFWNKTNLSTQKHNHILTHYVLTMKIILSIFFFFICTPCTLFIYLPPATYYLCRSSSSSCIHFLLNKYWSFHHVYIYGCIDQLIYDNIKKIWYFILEILEEVCIVSMCTTWEMLLIFCWYRAVMGTGSLISSQPQSYLIFFFVLRCIDSWVKLECACDLQWHHHIFYCFYSCCCNSNNCRTCK